MLFHNLSKEKTLETLMTDEKNGLSQKHITNLREKYGYNKLNEKKKKTT